jgi:FG-GAP repeat
MVGSAGGVRTAQGCAGELAANAPRGMRCSHGLIATALVAIALAASLCASLAGAHLQALAGALSSLAPGSHAHPAAARRAAPAPGARPGTARAGLSSLPLTAQGSVSQALGADDPAYRIHASGRGFSGVSSAQRLSLGFDRAGVSVSAGAAHVGLSLRAVGYGGVLAPVGGVSPRALSNRVSYERAGISEWYLNGPLGLEQGFTVDRAPSQHEAGKHEAGTLTLAMALSGNAHAALASDGQSVTLSQDGRPVLRYTGLRVTDANGRALHAWLQLHGEALSLRVDTHGARYPLRIDPFIQQAKLTGGEEAGDGQFGYSVALSSDGNTALIGGPYDGDGAGAAWVFTRESTSWTQEGAKLTGTEEAGEGHFGWSVALSSDGDTALVGASRDHGGVGAAWVFIREDGSWSQQGPKLTAAEEVGAGRFGYSVALSSDGDTALIGGPYDHESVGAAWVYAREDGSWSQQGAKLSATEENGAGLFGLDVALSSDGETALIGSPYDSEGVGAAWAFIREEDGWTQQGAKLTGKEEIGPGWFGYSVALSSDGNTALIGGFFDHSDNGAAWAFIREEDGWTQQGAKLTGKGEIGAGWFGYSVALSSDGNTALIGGFFDDDNSGAAWEFTREHASWTQRGTKLDGKEEIGEAHFGYSVALSADADTALIGGPNDDGETGGAWVFEGEAPTAVTGAASSVAESSATLNATVNPHGAAVGACDFEYGESEYYGSSAPCSSLPGTAEEPIAVSAAVAELSAARTYHFRIVATTDAGTSYGEDHIFATLASPPEFGRCLKVTGVKEDGKLHYHGGYTKSSCTERSETNSGKYEWHPGIAGVRFTSSLKKGAALLETFARERITCKTEMSTGEYTGPKEVTGVALEFSGCESLSGPCTTPGLEEGRLETEPLEGRIGWEAKATRKVGLDLYPVGGSSAFMEYGCAGHDTISVQGSLIAAVKAGKMLRSSLLTFKQKAGIQVPEHLEGEPLDALIATLNGESSEPLGVSFVATLSSEEPVEINTTF